MKKGVLQFLGGTSKSKDQDKESARKYKGIDVSKWQGEINWEAVKADGIQFAMLKLGSGNKNGNGMRLDEYFERNVREAVAVGMDIGCYFYSYAHNNEEAELEAQFVIETLKNYPAIFTYPIVLDLEHQPLESLGKDILTNIVLTFGSVIENAGYQFAFYSNPNWLTYMLHSDQLTSFDLWLAEWKTKPTYKGNYTMWQYGTDEVNGINGDVDMDISYKDYPTIIMINELNGFKLSNPTPINKNPIVNNIKEVFCIDCKKPNSCLNCDINRVLDIVEHTI